MLNSFPRNLIVALTGVVIFLVLAHIFVLYLATTKKDKDFTNLKLRMRSWWLIISFLMFVFLGGRVVAITFIGLICFLALKEYFAFLQFKPEDRKLLFWGYLSIPIQMYFLYINWLVMFYLFVPLYMFLIIPVRKILIGDTQHFIRCVGLIQWGVLLNVYSLGHLGAFLNLPLARVGATSDVIGTQLLLFLLIINTANDAAQYTWGKLFGQTKIVPTISPNKTWAGFFGGVVTTILLSILIAPYLTTLDLIGSACAGLLISIFGFCGDVVMSAVKRDVGVKDSSTLIPGHGGILDRVDSLSYTAPLFFHFFCYFYQMGI